MKENKFDIFCRYFFYFMVYSVIGWIYEVTLEVVIYQWGYSDRGILFGPYCPVYGVGAMLFLLCIRPFIRKKWKQFSFLQPVFVFLGCMFVATTVELLTTYIFEFFTGSWPWQTYADYSINFQARIALSPSIRFGLGGLLFLYGIQPLLERFTDSLSIHKQRILFRTILIIVILDGIATIIH